MKNKITIIATTIIGLILIFNLMSFKQSKNNDFNSSLPLGSIIYSILPQDVMNTKYPNQFILLSGKSLDETSSLYKLMDEQNQLDILTKNGENVNLLPDARGVFIRSMNLGQNKSKGDPTGNRVVGKYQSDGFKAHNHPLEKNIDYWDRSFKGEGGNPRTLTNGGKNVWVSKTKDVGIKDETRPKNITLYTYIKIN